MRPAAAKRNLFLANAVRQLDTGDGDGRVLEGLEPRHRCAAPLDRPMVLLNNVIQVLAGSHLDVALARMLFAQEPQRAPTGHVAIMRHFARYARGRRFERLAKEGFRGGNFTVATQQKVDCLAMLVHGPIQIMPLRFDRDVSLIDPPRGVDGSPAFSRSSLRGKPVIRFRSIRIPRPPSLPIPPNSRAPSLRRSPIFSTIPPRRSDTMSQAADRETNFAPCET